MTGPGPHDDTPTRRARRALRSDVPARVPSPPDAATSASATPPAAPTRRSLRTPAPPSTPRATPTPSGASTPPAAAAHPGAPSDARRARRLRAARIRLGFGVALAVALAFGGAAAVTSALVGSVATVADDGRASTAASRAAQAKIEASAILPSPVAALPAPTLTGVPATVDLCALPALTAALAAGDDAAVIAAAGGPQPFRDAVVGGRAPCIRLDDPARIWVVIDKARPANPVDYQPSPVVLPDGARSLEGGGLRADAAAALTALAQGAASAGVGEIALESGYRSYSTQVDSYGSQVSAQGRAEADLSSARPGFSEHQSGLAGDVVACDGGCGSLDDLAASAQGQWIAAHAWEYGWIVRYEDGHTPVTGYVAEPWHLRFIGLDLARAYHDGGWHTLEEFFGLPAAPDYLS